MGMGMGFISSNGNFHRNPTWDWEEILGIRNAKTYSGCMEMCI